VQLAELAQLPVRGQAERGRRKGQRRERQPEVFAECCGDRLFAEVGELAEGGVVLWGGGWVVSWIWGGRGWGLGRGGGREGTFRARVRE